MGSWAHDLKINALMSSRVVKNVFHLTQELDWQEIFSNSLRAHQLSTDDWHQLLSKYRCIREENLQQESVESLKPITENELHFASGYHCIGNFHDQYLKGNMLYFSIDTQDMGQRSMKILEKWNLAVSKTNLTLPKAFQNAQLISQFH